MPRRKLPTHSHQRTDILGIRELAPRAAPIPMMGTDDIQNGSIIGDKLADLCISTAKLIDAAITGAKIALGSILTGHIQDLQITNAKIANLAVTTAKIEALAVTNAKIGNASISEAKIQDAAISSAKIQDAAILQAKIGTAAVGTLQLGDLVVTTAKCAEALGIYSARLPVLDLNSYSYNYDGEDWSPWQDSDVMQFGAHADIKHELTKVKVEAHKDGSAQWMQLRIMYSTNNGSNWTQFGTTQTVNAIVWGTFYTIIDSVLTNLDQPFWVKCQIRINKNTDPYAIGYWRNFELVERAFKGKRVDI